MKIRKIASRALLILMVVALALSVTACGGKGDKDSSKGTSSILADGMANPYAPEGATLSEDTIAALQNSGDVVWYGGETLSDYDKEFIAYFEKYYGGNFSYKYQAYGDDLSQFLVDYAGGDAPDCLGMDYRRWPKAGNRRVVYSTKELKEMGILGLDHPELVKYDDICKNTYSIGDECFAFASAYCSPVIVAINTDLFKQYAVKSPVEYYKNGEWDYDVFADLAQKITRKAADGTEIFGFSAWNHSWFLTGNDCDLVKIDGKKIVSCVKDTMTVKTLESYKTLLVNGYYGGEFTQGTTAMLVLTADNIAQRLKNITFNWDIVPFPLGDNNTSGSVPCEITGMAVVSGTKNPQGAVNSAIARRMFDNFKSNTEYSGMYCSTYAGIYNEDQMEIINNAAKMGRQDLFMGVGNLNKYQHDFWNEIKAPTHTVAETIDKYNNLFVAQCEAEMENAAK